MPKFDKTRNYYADLDVSPNASVDDVKKQFKKLAMLYHPDKNVGKEAEANLKFQTIQSALEILTDPIAKAQYDEARKNHMSRFPRASGVRGNPYQDYGKEFARPPTRRPPAPSTPQPPPQPQSHSGAQRYKTFAKDVPRTAYSNVREDPQVRKSNAEAWESMRRRAPPPTARRAPAPAPTAQEAKSSNSNNVPPRTASQQQKAQASFGNRRTGYVPHSPGLGDEPSVPSNNYFTNRTHSSLFDGVTPDATQDDAYASTKPATSATSATPASADPLAQFKEKFWDGRQSTPYQTPGGEKTSLFDDGPAIGRSTSTRSPWRTEMPGAYPQARPRSSSTPRSTNEDVRSDFTPKMPSSHARASDRYKPKPDPSNVAGNSTTVPGTAKCSFLSPNFRMHHTDLESNSASIPGENSVPVNKGPSVYARPSMRSSSAPKPRPEQCSTRDKSNRLNQPTSQTANAASHPSYHPHFPHHKPPSEGVRLNPPSGGVRIHSANLSEFEKRMRYDLRSLISTLPLKNKGEHKPKDRAGDVSFQSAKSSANSASSIRFSFQNGGNTNDKSASTEGLARHSADNINTKFVEDELPDGWEFSAGNAAADGPQTSANFRPQSRARTSRRQTMKSKQPQTGSVPPVREGSENAAGQGFSAGQWSDQIGSQHFVPQPSRSVSNSPSRRPNVKKPKPVKMTAGTAGLVDEEDSEGFQESSRPSSKSGRVSTDSINAMDIDSPPPENVDSTPKASQTNGARKIPVEPYREEWRAGDLNGVRPKPASSAQNANTAKAPSIEIEDTSTTQPAPTPTANPFVAQHGGSEDTEEFRMSDFAKVEPFIDPAPRGLKDFSDLKSTLPFQSQPSEQIHLEREPAPKPLHLSLPAPPVAPRLPQGIAQVGVVRPNVTQFKKYVDDFHQYMDKWESFNSQIMGHFTTRENNFRIRRQQRGADWLDDATDDYLLELEQDKEVNRWWLTARDNHEAQIREFKLFRERVK
ncbi:hypothetical protein Hte_004899 [Hypoxylon texense]